jgi:hypothetical protein
MGLEALLGPKVSDAPATGAGQPTELPLDKLRAGKYQPRTRMDEGSLYELAESIRSQGGDAAHPRATRRRGALRDHRRRTRATAPHAWPAWPRCPCW